MRAIWTFIVALCVALSVEHALAVPSGLPDGVWTEDVLRDIGLTTDFIFLSADRLVVTRKNGFIDLYKKSGGSWAFSNVLVDIRDQVVDYADRGAMGITKHPQFPATPYIYISTVYGPGDVGGWKHNRLLRFSVYGDYADPGSQVILIGKCDNKVGGWYGGDCSPMLGTTHAIGWMAFGPDEKLYVAVGEGQTQEGGDWTKYGDMIPTTWALAMDPNFLGGKILRIDPITGKGLPDNPFYNGDPDSSRSRVWAVGLRNPFKCAFTPERDQVVCGNVGWAAWEMVAVLWRGSNAGWPCYEGNRRVSPPNDGFPACQAFYDGTSGLPPADIARSAAYTWSHEGTGSASIGGDFFPRNYPPSVAGKFLFADFAKSNMFLMNWKNKRYGATSWFGEGFNNPTAMKVNPYDGRIYYVGHCSGCDSYGIMRVFTYAGWKPEPVGPPPPPPPPPGPPPNGLKGWFCAPNFTAPIRMEDGNAVCMADKKKPGVCLRQKDQNACLVLANNPPATAVSVVCPAAYYNNPGSWCVTGRKFLQSTWSCIPKAGFYIPVKINTEGSASCMSVGGQRCLWAGPLKTCMETAAKPPKNAVEKKCAPSQNGQAGTICGQAWKWLDGRSVPVVYPWKCLGDGTGVTTPVFVRNGNIFCMSNDGGKTCAGAGTTTAVCQQLVKASQGKPLLCTPGQYKTAGHPCQLAFANLGNGWRCVDGVNTPVKLDSKGIATCMESTGKAGQCEVTTTAPSCISTALNAPGGVKSITCRYGDLVAARNNWCAKATLSLNGRDPVPPAGFCYNKKIDIPALPAGWSTIMRPKDFPEITYVRNGPGAGPVEIDGSVGGLGANDGQQITIAGNRYSYGLGVRASSEVKITFRDHCYAMVADVGVDDEMGGLGAGEFVVRSQSLAETVLANSTALRKGAYLRAGMEPFTMTVPNLHTLMGIRLQANRPSTFTVGNIANDHLDWGDIRLLCGPDAPYLPQVQASVTFVKGGTGRVKRAKTGDVVAYTGSATDFNGKPIPVERFEWFINLIHCEGPVCHSHPMEQIPRSRGLPSAASGQFTIDDHPLAGTQYYYFQVRFAVSDVCGRKNYVDKNIIVDK